MVHLHQNELDKIRDIRQTVMSNLYRKSRGKKEFYIGQVVMLRSDKSQLTTEDNSRALLSCESPYKIISLHSGDQSCRILSLINGDQRSVHISRLRALEINDIVGFQIKAKFLFENIKNMRLTNRYKRMNTGLQLNIRDSDVIQQKGDEQLQDEGKLQTGQNGQLQDEEEQLQSDQSDQRQTINIDTIIQHENSQGAAPLKSILKKPLKSVYSFNRYQITEAEWAALKRALSIQRECNLPLSSFQREIIKNPSQDSASVKYYSQGGITDDKVSIMRRKNHPRHVKIIEGPHPERETEINRLYSIMPLAHIKAIQCCTSLQELRYF